MLQAKWEKFYDSEIFKAMPLIASVESSFEDF